MEKNHIMDIEIRKLTAACRSGDIDIFQKNFDQYIKMLHSENPFFIVARKGWCDTQSKQH